MQSILQDLSTTNGAVEQAQWVKGMSNSVEKYRGCYTYADYLAWDTDRRYELINGDAYMMSSPSVSVRPLPEHYISAVHDHAEAMEVSTLPGLRIDCTGIWSVP
jgi:hypothetical protein